jgi:fructose-1,6-bisphosphatase/sedoheptulose 1,7-bisphosphatase-like protein
VPLDLPWIDTAKDIPYPKSITTRKLTHLAAEHGFVNQMAHRAVTDVLTMLKVLSFYEAKTVVEWSSSPTIKIKAMVTRETKELAKERGSRWDAPSVAWFKEIKEFQLMTEIKDSSFKIVVVENAR